MSNVFQARSTEQSLHDRRLAARLRDPEFRAAFEREKAELEAVDRIINSLESLRDTQHLSKAQLAREIGKNPAAVRRLLTAPGNPTLRTVVAVAAALDAEVQIVPRSAPARPAAVVRHRVPRVAYPGSAHVAAA